MKYIWSSGLLVLQLGTQEELGYQLFDPEHRVTVLT